MAEEPVSPGREHARVPRNDLPQPIHSSARSVEKRADAAPSVPAADTPLAAFTCEWVKSLMLSPSGKGPRKSRTAPSPAIGRAILLGGTKNSHIATLVERTSFALYRAGQSAQQRHGCCSGRAEPARSETPRLPAALADLGPRAGDGETQDLHGGHECEGILLRSAEPLAARQERKHERAAAPVLLSP